MAKMPDSTSPQDYLTLHSPPTSEMEELLLRSTRPIGIEDILDVSSSGTGGEEIILNGIRGVVVNREEIRNWNPPNNDMPPITHYPINTDDSPRLVTKPTDMLVEYTQDFFIRYLRPPTPPEPGEIVIQELNSEAYPPAPPVIIRQQPPRPHTPEPIVFREEPPRAPPLVGRKLITISAQKLPPPPRKVIVERLPALPPKPQVVLLERWLPYTPQKRRVIFRKYLNGPVLSI